MINNFFNICCSNHIFYSLGKKYDKFRVATGAAYENILGRSKKIISKVTYEDVGLYRPVPLSELLESNSPAGDVTTPMEGREDPVVIPRRPSGDVFFNGMQSSVDSSRIFPVSPGPQSPSRTVGGGTVVGTGSRQNGNTTPFLRPLVFNLDGVTAPSVTPLVPFGMAGTAIYAEPSTGSAEGRIGGIGNVGGAVPANTLKNKIQVPKIVQEGAVPYPITPDNVHDAVLPNYVFDLTDDVYKLNNIDFQVKVDVQKISRDFGDWVGYRCRLYIPELITKLGEANTVGTRYFEFTPTIDGYKYQKYIDGYKYQKYVEYILNIQAILQEQINTKEVFRDYLFRYELPYSSNDGVPAYNIDIASKYNYYSAEFESNVEGRSEIMLPNIYDVFSSKSFDSRKLACGFRRKTVCFGDLAGTERNVVVLADDPEEVNFINSMSADSYLLPMGVDLKLPIKDSYLNFVLKDNKLLSRASLDVFSGTVLGSGPISEEEHVLITSGGKGSVISATFSNISLWLEGMQKAKFTKFDFTKFPVTLYDFGTVGKDISVNIDQDVSATGKAILASSALDDLKDYQKRSAVEMFTCTLKPSKKFGYYIQKSSGGSNVQRFCAVASNNEFTDLNLFDAQVKYNFMYKYDVDSFENFVYTDYYYDEDLGGVFLDKKDGSLYFSVFMRNAVGILNVPLIEKELYVTDNFPTPPVVEVEQYRDKKGEVLFMLQSGTGEYYDKFVALNAQDLEEVRKHYNKTGEVRTDGKLFFRSDDPAKIFEIYSTAARPKNYLDFSLLGIVNNSIMINNLPVVMSSNAFHAQLSLDKPYYFFFRQLDVHGKPSNPTDIYELRFNEFGDRAVLNVNVFRPEEIFQSMRQGVYQKSLRRYLLLKPKVETIKAYETWEKRYKIRLISKKTFRVSDFFVNLKISPN